MSLPSPATSTKYSFAYKDANWGWMSGGQDFTDRGQCAAVALRWSKVTGMPVRLKVMTTESTYEALLPHPTD